MGGKSTAISSVEHVVEVAVKRRLFLVTSVTPISTLKKSSIVYTAARHEVSAALGKIKSLVSGLTYTGTW